MEPIGLINGHQDSPGLFHGVSCVVWALRRVVVKQQELVGEKPKRDQQLVMESRQTFSARPCHIGYGDRVLVGKGILRLGHREVETRSSYRGGVMLVSLKSA